MHILNPIIELLLHQGHNLYGGEAVSQLEHALQCGTLAEAAGATKELITACLLHDIGHLVVVNNNLGHEYQGMNLLQPLFNEAVTQPILLHVEAKRYLCQAEPNYYYSLSTASKLSLEKQGGIFSEEQAKSFLENSYGEDAVKLRRWDEQAKVPNLSTPNLDHFIPIMLDCLSSQ